MHALADALLCMLTASTMGPITGVPGGVAHITQSILRVWVADIPEGDGGQLRALYAGRDGAFLCRGRESLGHSFRRSIVHHLTLPQRCFLLR